jgi:hypothetical protein
MACRFPVHQPGRDQDRNIQCGAEPGEREVEAPPEDRAEQHTGGQDRTRLIPVVILTSSAQEEDILAGYQAGANAYVCKPVDFTDFTRAIGALCAFWLLVSEPPPVAVSPAVSSAPSEKRDLVHPAMAEADPARPGALRGLILDDNPSDAELARRLLSRSDHDFAIAVADDRTSYAHQLAASGRT